MNDEFFHKDLMIDFHTHTVKHSKRPEILEIVSSTEFLGAHFFTLERHPWNSSVGFSEEEIELIKSQLKHPKCLAFGEIGLDKLQGIDFQAQLSNLKTFLKLAQNERKSVVIHCVKSFDEIIRLKKENKEIPAWAIHGFNKSPELAKQLIDLGFYLSLNVGKMNRPENLLNAIPIEKLFLETDDSLVLIEENYLRAAEILGMEFTELKSQIARNAKHFFEHG